MHELSIGNTRSEDGKLETTERDIEAFYVEKKDTLKEKFEKDDETLRGQLHDISTLSKTSSKKIFLLSLGLEEDQRP